MYDVRVHNWRYEDVEKGLSYPSMVLMFVHMSSCMMMVRVVGGMSGAICVRGCLLAYTWVASFLPIRSNAPPGRSVSLVAWSCAFEARFSSHSLEVMEFDASASWHLSPSSLWR